MFCILCVMFVLQDTGMPRNTDTDKREERRIQYRQFRLPIPTPRAGMRQQRFEPGALLTE